LFGAHHACWFRASFKSFVSSRNTNTLEGTTALTDPTSLSRCARQSCKRNRFKTCFASGRACCSQCLKRRRERQSEKRGLAKRQKHALAMGDAINAHARAAGLVAQTHGMGNVPVPLSTASFPLHGEELNLKVLVEHRQQALLVAHRLLVAHQSAAALRGVNAAAIAGIATARRDADDARTRDPPVSQRTPIPNPQREDWSSPHEDALKTLAATTLETERGGEANPPPDAKPSGDPSAANDLAALLGMPNLPGLQHLQAMQHIQALQALQSMQSLQTAGALRLGGSSGFPGVPGIPGVPGVPGLFPMAGFGDLSGLHRLAGLNPLAGLGLARFGGLPPAGDANGAGGAATSADPARARGDASGSEEKSEGTSEDTTSPAPSGELSDDVGTGPEDREGSSEDRSAS